MTATPLVTTARNAELADMVAILKSQQAHKLDLVIPATAMHAEGGLIRIDDTQMVVEEDGISMGTGKFRPTQIADEHLAEKLGVPLAYLRRLRDSRTDLYDANVNGWLHGSSAFLGSDQDYPGDDRTFMARCFRGDENEDGIMRALLSDRYMRLENLDVVLSALQGIKDAGVNAEVYSCDLSDRRMYVKVVAPEVQALAPVLLKGYRNPFDGNPEHERQAEAHGYLRPDDQPTVFAGFIISNSETGGGAYNIVPQLMVKVCRNGLVITADAIRRVHIGSKLDEGVVRWSDETQRKSLELVAMQTRDAVATFLDVDYISVVIEQLEAKADRKVNRPAETVKAIGKQLLFTDAQCDGILDHFIKSGQVNAAGVLNAVTSYAQLEPDADEAMRLSSAAMKAFELAAA